MLAGVLSKLESLWHQLTEPAASVPELDRRQVRLLSSLLVFVIAGTLLIVVLWGIIAPEDYNSNNVEVYIGAGLCLSLAAAYALNRRARYRSAALLTVTAVALAVFVLAVTDPSGAIWLVYLVIPIILSSVLLPMRTATAFAAANLGVMLILPTAFKQLIVADMPTDFVFLASGLLLLVAHHRNQLEQDRQRTLARSEERFSKIFHISPVAIGISTLDDGRLLDANDHMLMLLGYSRDEFVGHRIADLKIHAGAMPREELWANLRQQGGVPNYETRWRTQSGQILDVISSAAIIELDGVPCMLGMGIDITQLKQAERDLRDKERMEIELRKERELGEIKRRFMITAAHEFRTPLAIVLASSEMVEMYSDRITPERRIENFATIRTQVMSLGEMLDDMRMILDIEGGSVAFDPTPQDMTRLCRTFVDEIYSSLGSRHTLTFTSEGDCSAVPLDGALFERIVKSLLSNAIKFSPQGGEVRIHLVRRDDSAVLTVSDDGIGIPVIDHPRIFEPYHRAANALNIPGIGLGLAIVRNFVKQHLGQVEFNSEEGKGTTFIVTLPAT